MSEELREAIARNLAPTHWPMLLERHRERLRAKADRILSLPTIAALIADADRVQRVRKLVDFYDRHEYSSLNVDDLRRALDGDQ